MQARRLETIWPRGLFGWYVDGVLLHWGSRVIDLATTPLTEQQARWIQRQAKKTADRRRLRKPRTRKEAPTVAAAEAHETNIPAKRNHCHA